MRQARGIGSRSKIQAMVARITSIAKNVIMNRSTNSLPGQLGRGSTQSPVGGLLLNDDRANSGR
jgi:hypothetical protein